MLTTVSNVKALVGNFNLEKALVGAFSVITNLRMQFGCNFLKHYLQPLHRLHGLQAQAGLVVQDLVIGFPLQVRTSTQGD